MWGGYKDICPIISITNAQSKKYWADRDLYDALEKDNDQKLVKRKIELKKQLFEVVADQTGKLFDPEVLTIVWARRFAAYKRADLITQDEKFQEILANKDYPVQIIWSGKPYPMDFTAISMFNSLVHMSKQYKNMTVLLGYELKLSKQLKGGADIWLNNPQLPREASGTSGMTAAMNGALNFSTYDGWIPEFAKHDVNCFIVPPADLSIPQHQQDQVDMQNLHTILEKDILKKYYDDHSQWLAIVKNSMHDVVPYFDSDRMAYQYYEKVYNYQKIG